MLRCRLLLVLMLGVACQQMYAQELFAYTEPASNMAKRSVGLRMTNWLMRDVAEKKTNYHLIPEVMWGASKKLMLHADAFVSNRVDGLSLEGVGAYAKYRFLSIDQVHRHLRLASFGRATTNNAAVHQEEIGTYGHNTGYQLGLVGTQLLHKTALSVTGYYERALNNGSNEFPSTLANSDLSYILSVGHLFLPVHYSNYKQTNFNVMAEVLGQVQPESGRQYIDIAPSVQLIFNSQTRVDIGYRHQLYSSLKRSAPNGLLIRIEHLIYNVL